MIPQFTEASTEAKQSSLVSDLQTARSQIELYKIQHLDNLPGTVNGATPTAALFRSHMEGYTDVYGVAQTGPGDGVFGPYLQKIPTNPFATNGDTVVAVTTNPTAADTTNGWFFNTSTGSFGAYSDPNL